MRTVITHFFNEEYLLPWWLKHHIKIFDYGILIDHGSNDESINICREIAPHWRIVRIRLTNFEAFTTDWEVMGFEQELPGWKIALNVTEFLLPTIPMLDLETQLVASGRTGCAASAYIFVDCDPHNSPSYDLPLPSQKFFGIDDNGITDPNQRALLGLNTTPARNRFYHSNPLGMYAPGRHSSYHPDSRFRVSNFFLGHFGFSPWNEKMIQRRIQIGEKIAATDKKIGFGQGHERNTMQLEAAYKAIRLGAVDLRNIPLISSAISNC